MNELEQNQKNTKLKRREIRKEGKALNKTRARNKRLLKKIIIWGLSIVLVVWLGYVISQSAKKSETNKPGELFASQGQAHIAFGSKHPEYNSNPPTSGWHYA